jgi:hypothetical protein
MGIGAAIVLTRVARIDSAGRDCMHSNTDPGGVPVEASPQLSAEVVLYHSAAAMAGGRGVMPSAVPDMGMRAEAMGSEGQAREWWSTEAPPADSPKRVMREGSPPKEAMLSRIHSRARRWSRRPGFWCPCGLPGKPKIVRR